MRSNAMHFGWRNIHPGRKNRVFFNQYKILLSATNMYLPCFCKNDERITKVCAHFN